MEDLKRKAQRPEPPEPPKPSQEEIYVDQGRTHLEKGEPEPAMEMAKQALLINPSYKPTNF
jgi:hypothetical protein